MPNITSHVKLKLQMVSKNLNDLYPRKIIQETTYINGIVFKTDTDLVNPVIELGSNKPTTGGWTEFSNYNYAIMTFYDEYGSILRYKYYWIQRLEYITLQSVRLYLKEDVLQTFANEIKASTQWVSRSYSSCDAELNDPLAIIKGKPTVVQTLAPSILSTYHGYFVVGLTGCNDGTDANLLACKRGSVKYFIIDDLTITALIERLQHLTGVVADRNPIDRLVSVMYIPCDITTSAPGTTNVTFYFNDANGQSDNQTFAMSAYQITTNHDGVVELNSQIFNLPIHPQYDANHVYLRQAPYTKHVIHAGIFGDIEIDPNYIDTTGNYETVYLDGTVDIVSGQGQLIIGSGYGFRRDVAMLGVSIPVTQITSYAYSSVQAIKNQYKSEMMDILMNEYDTIASMGTGATGNMLNSSKISITGNVINTVASGGKLAMYSQYEQMAKDKGGLSLYNASLPTVCMNGASGSMLGVNDDWYVISTFQKVLFPDYESIGYPCQKKLTLSALSGFVKCDTALWNGTTTSTVLPVNTSEEREELNEFLLNGIFLNSAPT